MSVILKFSLLKSEHAGTQILNAGLMSEQHHQIIIHTFSNFFLAFLPHTCYSTSRIRMRCGTVSLQSSMPI